MAITLAIMVFIIIATPLDAYGAWRLRKQGIETNIALWHPGYTFVQYFMHEAKTGWHQGRNS